MKTLALRSARGAAFLGVGILAAVLALAAAVGELAALIFGLLFEVRAVGLIFGADLQPLGVGGGIVACVLGGVVRGMVGVALFDTARGLAIAASVWGLDAWWHE